MLHIESTEMGARIPSELVQYKEPFQVSQPQRLGSPPHMQLPPKRTLKALCRSGRRVAIPCLDLHGEFIVVRLRRGTPGHQGSLGLVARGLDEGHLPISLIEAQRQGSEEQHTEANQDGPEESLLA